MRSVVCRPLGAGAAALGISRGGYFIGGRGEREARRSFAGRNENQGPTNERLLDELERLVRQGLVPGSSRLLLRRSSAPRHGADRYPALLAGGIGPISVLPTRLARARSRKYPRGHESREHAAMWQYRDRGGLPRD